MPSGIRERREALHMTMTELAERVQMDLGKLSRLERGHLRHDKVLAELRRIADALGCTLDDLHLDMEPTTLPHELSAVEQQHV